jgi:hypothetical protein
VALDRRLIQLISAFNLVYLAALSYSLSHGYIEITASIQPRWQRYTVRRLGHCYLVYFSALI